MNFAFEFYKFFMKAAFLTNNRNGYVLASFRRPLSSPVLLYGANEFSIVVFRNWINMHVPIRLLPESLPIQSFSICSGPREPRGWISLSTTVKDASRAENKGLMEILISKTCCGEKDNLALKKIKEGIVFNAFYKLYVRSNLIAGVHPGNG